MRKNHTPSKAEAEANVTGDWRKALAQAEADRSVSIDWMGLEATLNAYSRATDNTDLRDIVTAFTGR